MVGGIRSSREPPGRVITARTLHLRPILAQTAQCGFCKTAAPAPTKAGTIIRRLQECSVCACTRGDAGKGDEKHWGGRWWVVGGLVGWVAPIIWGTQVVAYRYV